MIRWGTSGSRAAAPGPRLGGSRGGIALRLVLALIFAGGYSLVGASAEARAEAGVWWLPSSWLTVAAGVVGDFTTVVDGVGLPVDGGGSVVVGPHPTPYTGCEYRVTAVEVISAGVVEVWNERRSCSGTAITSWAGFVEEKCVDGSIQPNTSGITRLEASATTVDGTVAYEHTRFTMGASECGGHGGTAALGTPLRDLITVRWSEWWAPVAGGVVTVTEVTCRSSSGGPDVVVSETSDPGATVAPHPVCPPGSFAVRVKVLVDGVVVTDTSISAAAIDQYGNYLANPDGWDWHSTSPDDCYIQQSDDPTMVILMSTAVCNEADTEGGTDPGTPPTDCGADVVCLAVQEVGKNIGRTVTGIATAVNRVIQAIKDMQGVLRDKLDEIKGRLPDPDAPPEEGDPGGITGEGACAGQGPLLNAANPVEWVWKGTECALSPDPAVVADGWDRIRGALGEPMSGWSDALSSIPGAWAMTPGSCAGPALNMPLGPPVGTFTLHPLDACTEPMATVAVISKLLATVALLSSAAWAAAGAVAAGLGYSGGGS